MFRNRALQVKMVKDNKEPSFSSTTTGHWHLEPEQINKIVKDQVKNTVIVVGGALAAKKLLSTICEVAVIAAKAKLS